MWHLFLALLWCLIHDKTVLILIYKQCCSSSVSVISVMQCYKSYFPHTMNFLKCFFSMDESYLVSIKILSEECFNGLLNKKCPKIPLGTFYFPVPRCNVS